MSIPKQDPPKLQHVRALYHHQGNNETQLSFNEGDTIALIGEKRDGWHYGENTTTNRYEQISVFDVVIFVLHFLFKEENKERQFTLLYQVHVA